MHLVVRVPLAFPVAGGFFHVGNGLLIVRIQELLLLRLAKAVIHREALSFVKETEKQTG